MKIQLFENFEVDLDVQYVLRTVDMAGDEMDIPLENEDFNYNPYDLEEMVKLYIKKKKEYDQINIFKITEEVIDEETINKIKLNLTAKKYNL